MSNEATLQGLSIAFWEPAKAPEVRGANVTFRETPAAPVARGASIQFVEIPNAPVLEGVGIFFIEKSTHPKMLGSTVNELAPNCIFKVQNAAGQPLENVSVTIESWITDRGLTDANGIYAGNIIVNKPNVLILRKPGYKTYRHRFTPEMGVDWEVTMSRSNATILTSPGNLKINLQPTEPSNQTFK